MSWQTEEEDLFVLFAHLIPCCQHFRYDGKPKHVFEAAMEARLMQRDSQARTQRQHFVNALLAHPVNGPLDRYTTDKEAVSWENIIGLMRNIFCHEVLSAHTIFMLWSELQKKLKPSLIKQTVCL
jgi:hypothetical protein